MPGERSARKHAKKKKLNKKLLVICLCAAGILLCGVFLAVELSLGAGDIKIVSARLLNVRAAPSSDAKIEGGLYLGEHVRVVEDSGMGFVRVATAHGLEGWCSSQYLRSPGMLTSLFLSFTAPRSKNLYYTNDDVEKDLQRLVKQYPGQAGLSSIGQSVWGQELWMLTLGDPAAQSCIMVQGAIHAREYATAKLCVDLARQLLEQGLAEDTCVVFIPLINPDGAALCQKGITAAPKELRGGLIAMNNGFTDFSRWKSNGRGVDLNSNFPALWQPHEDYPQPASQGYRGPYALSEPESVATVDTALCIDADYMVCYHSYGQIIYWYFGQENGDFTRDEGISRELASLTGYKSIAAQRPITSVGGAKDWFVQQTHKPGFTIEIFSSGVMPATKEMYAQELSRHEGVLPYLLSLFYQ